MIFPLGGLVLGALFGFWRAKSKGGKVLDLLQWSAVFALIGTVIGLFILVAIERSLV